MSFPKKFTLIFLIAITLTALVLRIYKLGLVPNGLATDEADLGYNAYSIIKTGADVYGRKFPIFFQSLDDYKPGLVFYTTIPAIAIFGLNDFSVRLAPAIFGSLLPLIIFLLMRKIYPKSQTAAYFAAIFFAFDPALVGLSRVMIWYIEALFLYALSLLLFFASLEKHRTLLPLAAAVLALTVYVNYAAIIYLVPIVALVGILWAKQLIKFPKISLLSLVILFLIIFPAIIQYINPLTRTRLDSISVLTPDITLPLSISELEQDKQEGFPLAGLVHNRRLVFTSEVLNNYSDYFNLDYLFINAKNTRYLYVNYVGLFYLVELPFFLYGLYSLITRRQKIDILLLGLLIIAPIPAMITLGSPFPHRAILLILAIPLVTATGIYTFLQQLSRFKSRKQVLTILVVAFCANIFFFLHQYFAHTPKEFTSEFDNGAWFSTVRDAIPKVNALQDKYDKIIFTWSTAKLVPPVYFLFYSRVDPKIIQAKAAGWTNDPPSYRQILSQIDNIEFRPIDWYKDKNLKNTLLVGYPLEFPKNVQVIDKTSLPNGDLHFVFVETQ